MSEYLMALGDALRPKRRRRLAVALNPRKSGYVPSLREVITGACILGGCGFRLVRCFVRGHNFRTSQFCRHGCGAFLP